MEGFGFQEQIELSGRKFKIHTGYNPQKNLAISEVFEHGNFLFNAEEKCFVRKTERKKLDEAYLKEVTEKIHKDTMEEILILFQVNEKLKLIRQAQPHFRLGKIFFVRNFLAEAIDNFKRAIRLQPDFVKAHKLLGLSYLKQRDFDTASKILKSIIDVGNSYPDILNTLGVIYMHFRQYEAARDVLQSSLQLKPDYIQANFNMGLLLFLSALEDDPTEKDVVIPNRILRFLKLIRKQKQFQNQIWDNIFDQLDRVLESGERDKIIHALIELQIRMTVQEEINTTIDFFFLRFMYGGKELSRSELDFYERLIRREGKDELDKYADYWNELGVIHLIQCRDYFMKALSEFEDAVKINPKYEASLNSLDLMRHGKKGFLILLRAILK